MNEQKAIMCKICTNQIKGEYIVRGKKGTEEYYHPQCAKDKELHLPVTIKFTGEVTPLD